MNALIKIKLTKEQLQTIDNYLLASENYINKCFYYKAEGLFGKKYKKYVTETLPVGVRVGNIGNSQNEYAEYSWDYREFIMDVYPLLKTLENVYIDNDAYEVLREILTA